MPSDFLSYAVDLLTVENMRLDHFLPLLLMFHEGTVQCEGYDVPTNDDIAYMLKELTDIDLVPEPGFFSAGQLMKFRDQTVTCRPSREEHVEIFTYLTTED